MKFLKSMTILTCLLINAAFAGVSEEVKTLQQLALGGKEHSFTKSKDATGLLKKFIEKDHGEFDGERFINKEIEAMSFGDEIEFGFTSARSAREMAGFAQGQIEEVLDNVYDDEAKSRELKAKIYDLNKGWAPVIKKLERLGVKFAYDGHGPGYCGVSFIRLLVVDPQTNKVYEVHLSENGPC